MDPGSALETFTCERHHCTLTRRACAERRAARLVIGRNKRPTYPGCQECDQGTDKATGISTDHVVPRLYGRNNKSQTTGGDIMGYPNKIDNDKLKAMLAAGKFTDEIAETFDCVESAVNRRIKRLGLKPNYRRKHKDGNAAPPAPGSVRHSGRDLTYTKAPAAGPVEAQIIPVTLRLTVEVNVRVNAGVV